MFDGILKRCKIRADCTLVDGKMVWGKRSWEWLMKNNLIKVGETVPLVTQEQALRTINIGKVTDREQVNRKYRMYGEREFLLLNIKNWPSNSIQFKDNTTAIEICKTLQKPLLPTVFPANSLPP